MNNNISAEKSIIATLLLGDMFNKPLTEEELYKFRLYDGATGENIKAMLAEGMPLRSLIDYKDGYYYFRDRPEILALHKESEQTGEVLWHKARKIAGLLEKIPFIQMLGITGSLSRNSTGRNSDIDFLIVAKPKRIFLCWFVTNVIIGYYNKKCAGKAGRLCLNMYITGDGANLEKYLLSPDDVYLPFWIANTVFVYGSGVDYFSMNKWIAKYFPNWRPPCEQELAVQGHKRRPLFDLPGDILERICKAIRYWLRPCSGEFDAEIKKSYEVSDCCLKLHKEDKRPQFLTSYKRFLDLYMQVLEKKT